MPNYLPQDSAAFLPVGNDHLKVLAGLLVVIGGHTVTVAKEHTAALVGHAFQLLWTLESGGQTVWGSPSVPVIGLQVEEVEEPISAGLVIRET